MFCSSVDFDNYTEIVSLLEMCWDYFAGVGWIITQNPVLMLRFMMSSMQGA